MQVIKNKIRSRLVDAAEGRIQCDLSINNIQLVNVLTGEIYPANVDIINGIIARVRDKDEQCEIESKKVIDGNNNYLLPGFIDVHMHVESTMMTPQNFGKAAICWGTTTAVTDPHEIANVMGIEGVEFMLQSAARSPLRIYTLAPSCVPSVPKLENAGAFFGSQAIKELLRNNEVIGVAEVMDYNGVINNDERMRAIIDEGEAANGFIQGHAPFVRGKDLCAYLCGGPVSDHETRNAKELIEKMRKGMHVNIKSSSLSDTVQEFIKGVKNIPIDDLVSLCTDDVHAADLLDTGHINHIVSECIKGGIPNLRAIRFGTINAARELGFTDIGAIAPGYVADLQLVNALWFENPPLKVFIAGKLMAISGKYVMEDVRPNVPFSYNTVNIPQVKSPYDFSIKYNKDKAHCIVFSAARKNMTPTQKEKYEWFDVKNGKVQLNTLSQCFISVINRYGNGNTTTVVCDDFNLKKGCIASTISHDSHNMTIVYRDPNDAYVAAKALEECGGGMCFVENGEVKNILKLPIGGLMSDLPASQIALSIEVMKRWVEYACDGENSMLLAIAILALPVRPGIIITDKGIVRGETQEFIPQILEGE